MTTGFSKKPTPKPTLDAKLIAWARAFHAVLDEMVRVDAGGSPDYHIEAAATVAASLVAGTDLEDR